MSTTPKRFATMGWRAGASEPTSLSLHPDDIAKMSAPPAHFALSYVPPPVHDPKRLTIGRWAAVVLEADRDAAARALEPLIEHRRSLGQLWGDDGIIAVRPPHSQAVESWRRALERSARPGALPHYLLFVGGPERIPFELQLEQDPYGCTGRLDVSDEPDGSFSWDACRRYAEKVVAYEQGAVPVVSRVLLYSINSEESSRLAHEALTLPLAAALAPAAEVHPLYGSDASRANLTGALRGSAAPRAVFTVSHGIEFPPRPVLWGALTDATYRGRVDDGCVTAELAAGHESFAHGSILFAFACFSAGVPAQSAVSFLAGEDDAPMELGARVAPLPRQLLGLSGGPVAFVGHLDRVTAVAFEPAFGSPGFDPYHDFLSWLWQPGATLGQAMSTLRERGLYHAGRITDALARAAVAKGDDASYLDAGIKWIGYHDFRNFLLVGDPGLTLPK